MTNPDNVDIGIEANERKIIAEGLGYLLADTYTLYLKTHNFHWNVEGPQFRELHLMFEEHYTELAQAVDEIAERIRTLGIAAPGTYKSFAQLSSIEEVEVRVCVNPADDVGSIVEATLVETCGFRCVDVASSLFGNSEPPSATWRATCRKEPTW